MYYLGNEIAGLVAGLGTKEASELVRTRRVDKEDSDALATIVHRRIAAVYCEICAADRGDGDGEWGD